MPRVGFELSLRLCGHCDWLIRSITVQNLRSYINPAS
jgi:hypothetical protein